MVTSGTEKKQELLGDRSTSHSDYMEIKAEKLEIGERFVGVPRIIEPEEGAHFSNWQTGCSVCSPSLGTVRRSHAASLAW